MSTPPTLGLEPGLQRQGGRKEFRLVSSPERWPLGVPARQRGRAQAGGQAGWDAVVSASAGLVIAKDPCQVLGGRGGGPEKTKEGLECRARP